MKSSTVVWIMVALILGCITCAVSLSVGWEIHSVERSLALSVLTMILVAVCAQVWVYYQRKASGIPETDERIDTINLHAFSYSYRIGIIFIIGLTWAALFFKNAAMFYSLTVSVFIMAGSFLFFRWYLMNKGDNP